MFQWGGQCFSDAGGASFLSGGRPMGASVLVGGGFKRKVVNTLNIVKGELYQTAVEI